MRLECCSVQEAQKRGILPWRVVELPHERLQEFMKLGKRALTIKLYNHEVAE